MVSKAQSNFDVEILESNILRFWMSLERWYSSECHNWVSLLPTASASALIIFPTSAYSVRPLSVGHKKACTKAPLAMDDESCQNANRSRNGNHGLSRDQRQLICFWKDSLGLFMLDSISKRQHDVPIPLGSPNVHHLLPWYPPSPSTTPLFSATTAALSLSLALAALSAPSASIFSACICGAVFGGLCSLRLGSSGPSALASVAALFGLVNTIRLAYSSGEYWSKENSRLERGLPWRIGCVPRRLRSSGFWGW